MKTFLVSLLRSPILRRWIDILLLSAGILVLGALFQASLSKVSEKWLSYSSAMGPVLSFAATLFIVALLSVTLIRLGALGTQFRFMTMLRHPPSWVAVILVSIVVGVMVFYEKRLYPLNLSSQDLSQFAKIAITVSLGVLLGFSYHGLDLLRSSPVPPKESTSSQTCHIYDNDNDLLEWVLAERPIRNPNQDMFGLNVPAQRVAKLLGNRTPSNIGIVGSYGAGKSSFINLVEYYLDQPPTNWANNPDQQFSGKIIRCRIGGWGLTSGTVTQKILLFAIEEVKRHVDCTSVIALPENYHKAIAGTKTMGGAFLSVLLQSPQEPVAQLCRLDKILVAANLRLIIVLEDLDRNVSNRIVGVEIPALLDRLRILDNVSFVLAIGTELHLSHMLIRICDHVEAIT